MTLLVVKHDQIRPQLCGWMHGLSVNKEPNTQDMAAHPTVGNYQRSLVFYLHRFHHGPAGEQRLRLNQCHSQPRTIQGDHHHPLQENNNGRRDYNPFPK